MIKEIIEGLNDDLKRYDSAIKIIKLNVSSKSSPNIIWGKIKHYKDSREMESKLEGTFLNGGKYSIMISNRFLHGDGAVVELEYSLGYRSDFRSFMFNDLNELKTNVKQISTTLNKLIKEFQERGIYNEFKSYKEIEKAVKSSKTVHYGKDAKRVVFGREDELVILIQTQVTKKLEDTSFDISRCFTK